MTSKFIHSSPENTVGRFSTTTGAAKSKNGSTYKVKTFLRASKGATSPASRAGFQISPCICRACKYRSPSLHPHQTLTPQPAQPPDKPPYSNPSFPPLLLLPQQTPRRLAQPNLRPHRPMPVLLDKRFDLFSDCAIGAYGRDAAHPAVHEDASVDVG